MKGDSEVPKCRSCAENHLECNREKELRFLYGVNAQKRPNFVFPENQRWISSVANSSTLQFCDETADIGRFYKDADREHRATAGSMIIYSPTHFGLRAVSSPATIGNLMETDTENRHIIERCQAEIIDVDTNGPLTTCFSMANSPFSTRSFDNSVISHQSLAQHFDPFTDREAKLMRNFTDNMAQWADVTDIERHFEIEVPRRALTNVMLRFAIFAFSSRHLAERQESPDLAEALEYHNRAIQLLIPQLSSPQEAMNIEVFIVVLVLRLDEEWHENDHRFHLKGATRILNGISSFISSGGLGEAAAWLCLRQDIAISVASQQPLNTSLDPFRQCRSIQKENDLSWALKMVLILGTALTCAFLTDPDERKMVLQQVNQDLQNWQTDKPVSYEPIKSIPMNREQGQCIPTVWMLSSFHVLGAVYYHMAKLVLLTSSLNDPMSTALGLENLQRARKLERSMRRHLLMILGLALSNPQSQNTIYSAIHSLEAWSGILRNGSDQEAALQFLLFAETALGWKMQRIEQALRAKWNQDSDSG